MTSVTTLLRHPLKSHSGEALDSVTFAADHTMPARIVKLPGRGFTVSDLASVRLCNQASHRAVEQQMGSTLSIHRWRGNIWFESDAPRIEFDWIGRDLRIGDCVVTNPEPKDRCLATTGNPETGASDADALAALDHWKHRDSSVRTVVKTSGRTQIGDRIEVL
jgi:uncharacterized protein YcbX